MKLLLKSLKIVDPASKYHEKTVDIFIQDDKIVKIGKNLTVSGAKVIDNIGACVSPGWFDIHVNFCDPGFETKEDLHSGARAAASGGFTGVAVMPNTQPSFHSKSEIEYICNQSKGLLVDVMPVGTVSHERAGKDLSEMYDMKLAGAVAFSDGNIPVRDAGLMSRALLYAKGIEVLVISFAEDPSIAQKGKMNEGEISTLLGVKGIPALAEELMVMRDIYLSEYHNTRIHFSCVSTSRSVELIRAAKKRGVAVTADVSINNLYFDDGKLVEFDSNYKVKPPLRTMQDIKALKAGLKDGTIDAICSQHTPEDLEHKNVEFEIASYGMIGLQTCFSLAIMSLSKMMSIESIIEKITSGPRNVLGLSMPVISEGEKANITIFDPEKTWTLKEERICSKSKNTPLLETPLVGKVLAVYNNQQFKSF